MKYGIRAEGQFFICPLCPLFKSFATAGLDPLIHLQKKRGLVPEGIGGGSSMGSNASRIGQASTLYFHKAHESFYVEMHICDEKGTMYE